MEYSFYVYVQVKRCYKDGGINLWELKFMRNLEEKKGNRALGVK